MNRHVPSAQQGRPGVHRRVAGWLMSWGLPLVIGLLYFATYYPGFTNHDSQSTWLNAFRYVADPVNTPLLDWYSPFLTAARIAALESGLGVAGYHALFCFLSYGTWALLVGSMLRLPWQRCLAHLLLLLPFIGANLAFQAADVWAAAGLGWMIIALRLGHHAAPGRRSWVVPLLYFTGVVLVIGARLNAVLALPFFIAVPALLRCHPDKAVRRACAAAPLAALVVVYAAISSLPIREQFKIETYMAYETIGVWKSVLAAPDGAPPDAAPPRVFELLPQPPGYYLARWSHANVDQIIWDTREFADKQFFIAKNTATIREDYFRTITRHPWHFAKMKLRFMQNGLGLTPPDALPVSSPPPAVWIDQLGIPLYHRPLAPSLTRPLLAFNNRTLLNWQPLTAPLGWCALCLVVFAWRLKQGRVTRFDYAWLILLGAYYSTILFFAPVYLPRYVFPIWIVLGAGLSRLLLDTDAGHGKTAASAQDNPPT